jgi:hypothetical protein
MGYLGTIQQIDLEQREILVRVDRNDDGETMRLDGKTVKVRVRAINPTLRVGQTVSVRLDRNQVLEVDGEVAPYNSVFDR